MFPCFLVMQESSLTWLQVSQLLGKSCTILAVAGPPLDNQIAISHCLHSASKPLPISPGLSQMREGLRDSGLGKKEQQIDMTLDAVGGVGDTKSRRLLHLFPASPSWHSNSSYCRVFQNSIHVFSYCAGLSRMSHWHRKKLLAFEGVPSHLACIL